MPAAGGLAGRAGGRGCAVGRVPADIPVMGWLEVAASLPRRGEDIPTVQVARSTAGASGRRKARGRGHAERRPVPPTLRSALQRGLGALPSPRAGCNACAAKVASGLWPSRWPCDARSPYEQQRRGGVTWDPRRGQGSDLTPRSPPPSWAGSSSFCSLCPAQRPAARPQGRTVSAAGERRGHGCHGHTSRATGRLGCSLPAVVVAHGSRASGHQIKEN